MLLSPRLDDPRQDFEIILVQPELESWQPPFEPNHLIDARSTPMPEEQNGAGPGVGASAAADAVPLQDAHHTHDNFRMQVQNATGKNTKKGGPKPPPLFTEPAQNHRIIQASLWQR